MGVTDGRIRKRAPLELPDEEKGRTLRLTRRAATASRGAAEAWAILSMPLETEWPEGCVDQCHRACRPDHFVLPAFDYWSRVAERAVPGSARMGYLQLRGTARMVPLSHTGLRAASCDSTASELPLGTEHSTEHSLSASAQVELQICMSPSHGGPKGLHWRTYLELRQQYDHANANSWPGWVRRWKMPSRTGLSRIGRQWD